MHFKFITFVCRKFSKRGKRKYEYTRRIFYFNYTNWLISTSRNETHSYKHEQISLLVMKKLNKFHAKFSIAI